VSALTKCDPDWGPRDPKVSYKYRSKLSEIECLTAVKHKSNRDDIESDQSSNVSDPPSYTT